MNDKEKQQAYDQIRQLKEILLKASGPHPGALAYRNEIERIQARIHFGSRVPDAARMIRCQDCKGTLIGAYRTAAFSHTRCDSCYKAKYGTRNMCKGCGYIDKLYDMSADNGVCEDCFRVKRFEKEPVTELSLANHFFYKF